MATELRMRECSAGKQRKMRRSSRHETFLWELVFVTLLTFAVESEGSGPPSKPPRNYPIQVQSSNIDDVPKYATVIKFNVNLVNKGRGEHPQVVTVTPEKCCLKITPNDIDCDSMELRPPATLYLGQVNRADNKTDVASFLFRNLYCRFRKGSCAFIISAKGSRSSATWKHTLTFSTYPPDKDDDYDKCKGVDQDADRSCSPVDCAVKYKGKRNFYRSSKGLCEPVEPCHTRGKDGVTITAYYDTDLNQCHSLDLNSSDNAVYMTEKFTGSPADRQVLKKLMDSVDGKKIKSEDLKMDAMMGAGTPLDCNHGTQKGQMCVCDSGWASSGIDSKMKENWCDVRDTTNRQTSTGPIRLKYKQELIAIISLSVVNVLLLVGWCTLVGLLFFWHKCFPSSSPSSSLSTAKPKPKKRVIKKVKKPVRR